MRIAPFFHVSHNGLIEFRPPFVPICREKCHVVDVCRLGKYAHLLIIGLAKATNRCVGNVHLAKDAFYIARKAPPSVIAFQY